MGFEGNMAKKAAAPQEAPKEEEIVDLTDEAEMIEEPAQVPPSGPDLADAAARKMFDVRIGSLQDQIKAKEEDVKRLRRQISDASKPGFARGSAKAPEAALLTRLKKELSDANHEIRLLNKEIEKIAQDRDEALGKAPAPSEALAEKKAAEEAKTKERLAAAKKQLGIREPGKPVTLAEYRKMSEDEISALSPDDLERLAAEGERESQTLEKQRAYLKGFAERTEEAKKMVGETEVERKWFGEKPGQKAAETAAEPAKAESGRGSAETEAYVRKVTMMDMPHFDYGKWEGLYREKSRLTDILDHGKAGFFKKWSLRRQIAKLDKELKGYEEMIDAAEAGSAAERGEKELAKSQTPAETAEARRMAKNVATRMAGGKGEPRMGTKSR